MWIKIVSQNRIEATLQTAKITSQEEAFQTGKLDIFHIHKDASERYFALSHDPKKNAQPLDGLYSFVVLGNDEDLELKLGKCSHFYTAGKAQWVCAAGDVYFSKGTLLYFNDQSGTYHIQPNDPKAEQKRHAARRAVELVGFPPDKFFAYQPKPLLFSRSTLPQSTRSTPLLRTP